MWVPVAQSEEHRFPKPEVAGSSPAGDTTFVQPARSADHRLLVTPKREIRLAETTSVPNACFVFFIAVCWTFAPVSAREVRIPLSLNHDTDALCSGHIAAQDNLFVFTVSERANGLKDLNGDGDSLDCVLHLHDTATQKTTNLKLTANFVQVVDDFVFFTVGERSQGGRDLNGDGDARDAVAHLYRFSTGECVNTGLSGSVAHPEFQQRQFDGNYAVISVYESDQKNQDLNGDGDAHDRVVHLYDVETRKSINTGLSTGNWVLLADPVLVIEVSERDHQIDLNDDDDQRDFVYHVFDIATKTVNNLKLASDIAGTPMQARRYDRFIFLGVPERDQNGTDLTGDGDASDLALFVYETTTGDVRNLSLSMCLGEPDFLSQEIDRSVFLAVSESFNSTDFNGDGDQNDRVLHRFDLRTGEMANVRISAEKVRTYDQGLVLARHEDDQDDWNNDGDRNDTVLHTFTPGAPSSRSLGVAAFAFSVHATTALGHVSEASQGSMDRNEDGDVDDSFMFRLDLDTGEAEDLGFETGLTRVRPRDRRLGRTVSHAVIQRAEFAVGHDDNGDGDTDDFVYWLIDAQNAERRNLEFGTVGSSTRAGNGQLADAVLSEDWVALKVSERGNGGTDFNGDGDSLDFVLDVVPLTDVGESTFRRGDSNADGRTNISDAVFTIRHVASGEARPTCQKSADANDDGAVDLTDPIFLLMHLFESAPPPPKPASACGRDPTFDPLGCEEFLGCP